MQNNRSPAINAEFKRVWSCASILPYASMALCLIKTGTSFPVPAGKRDTRFSENIFPPAVSPE